MDINDFSKLFPQRAMTLNKLEEKLSKEIHANPELKGFLMIMDVFFYLFSDGISSTIDNSKIINQHVLLLYSEAFKRIRSSYLLAVKGYYFDSNSLLRSVFELNKGINAIRKGVLKIEEFFGDPNREPSFNNLSEKQKHDTVIGYFLKVDQKVNAFDDKDVPDDIKDSLRTFKSNMHISVHKCFAGIVMNYGNLPKGDSEDFFIPNTQLKFFELYLNSCCFMILMFLKNLINSDLLLTNKDKIHKIVGFIESAYSSMYGYHADVVKYIKLKY